MGNIILNNYIFKAVENKDNYYEIYYKDINIGNIGFDIISTMNEFKLVELKCEFIDYTDSVNCIKSFVEYLIKKEFVLKIIINCTDNLKEVIEEVGFALVKDSEYKMTKPMFLNLQSK